MSSPAIEIQGVRKAFRRREREPGAPWWRRSWKDKVALEELSLVIEAGGITGILGPNGSGKSTLIRILGTLLTPDRGKALVFGWDVVSEALEVRRHVNRVSVEAAFFKELSPWENMLYAARLYGSGTGGTRRRVVDVLQRLGLPHDVDEAAALCDRVLMMDGGRVLADGTPEQLCRQFEAGTLEDVFMHLTGKTLEAEEEEEEAGVPS